MITLRDYMKPRVDKWFKQNRTVFIQYKDKTLVRLYGENILRYDMIIALDLLSSALVETETLSGFLFINVEF